MRQTKSGYTPTKRGVVFPETGAGSSNSCSQQSWNNAFPQSDTPFDESYRYCFDRGLNLC